MWDLLKYPKLKRTSFTIASLLCVQLIIDEMQSAMNAKIEFIDALPPIRFVHASLSTMSQVLLNANLRNFKENDRFR